LQDIVTRYQVDAVLDPGMLHPNTGYALWRRTIEERNLPYQQVHQGMIVALGAQVTLQMLWPQQLHNSSNEELDNALIMQLVTPGLRVLLLGAAAFSKYALNGVLADIGPNYLQADVVQVVGNVAETFAPQLRTILQIAHPSVLVITPAALSPKERKAGVSSTVLDPASPIFAGASWQVIQTAEMGTVEVSTGANGFTIHAG
jgi:competence protein ComEC